MTNAQKRQAISELTKVMTDSRSTYSDYKDISEDPTYQVLVEVIEKLKQEVK